MPGALPDDAGEVAGAVASAIVGDDPVDVVDAVGGEPDLRPGEESDQTQIERAQRIFGLRLVPDDHEESATGRKVTIRFLHLEDVRALLPFGSAITVHGPTEARAHLRDLTTDLAHHYAPSPTS